MDEDFELDPAKSGDKHGIDFVEAQGLWRVFGITGRLPFPLEERWLRVARLGGRAWAAVFAVRRARTRLISVRRVRKDEVESHEQAARKAGEHDHEP